MRVEPAPLSTRQTASAWIYETELEAFGAVRWKRGDERDSIYVRRIYSLAVTLISFSLPYSSAHGILGQEHESCEVGASTPSVHLYSSCTVVQTDPPEHQLLTKC